jgi:hypothetical protein
MNVTCSLLNFIRHLFDRIKAEDHRISSCPNIRKWFEENLLFSSALAPSPSFRQSVLRRLPFKSYLPRPNRRPPSLSNFLNKLKMAQPLRDVDNSQHSYTGGHFRQRFKNLVGSYIDTKLEAGNRSIAEPPSQARLITDRLAEEEKLNSVDVKDVNMVQGEEKLVIFPTYAKVKPHLFHSGHQHPSTSKHGNRFLLPANVSRYTP